MHIRCIRNFIRVLDKDVCRTYCTQRAQKLSNAEIRKKRNELFEQEKKRQLSLITRIEKIEVQHKGPPEDCTLIMNKGLSTPYNCAMHIQELLMDRSVIAFVNGKPWDMHRPLEEDCELKFGHFKDENPKVANLSFWRSCSFLLGHVLETAFKDEYHIHLCSFPRPSVRSGSFVYDVDLPIPKWKPSCEELLCMSRITWTLKDLPFDRLEVDASVAMEMFKDNKFKSSQIPKIAEASRSGSKVTLYRVGHHIDISQGPMIATTAMIGRFNVAAIHDIECDKYGPLKRVQGIALPRQLSMHYWTYEQLQKRAAKFNNIAPLPGIYVDKMNKNNSSKYRKKHRYKL